MKNVFRNKINAVLLAVVFMFSIHTTYAKGFGYETTYETVSCGDCVCTYAKDDLYIFWIKIGSSRELTSIDCSGVM